MTQQPPKRKNKSRKAYPNNVLQVSNLVLVGKSVGIERNAIEDDVEYLLYQFVSVRRKPLFLFFFFNEFVIS